jgi:hypothetical protein
MGSRLPSGKKSLHCNTLVVPALKLPFYGNYGAKIKYDRRAISLIRISLDCRLAEPAIRMQPPFKFPGTYQ